MKHSSFAIFASVALLMICGLFIFAGCGKAKSAAIEKYGSDRLKLYLPGAYMSDSLIPNFEKQYGVKVIVEYFDSNEMMYAKVQAGDKYDVLIPSDYMIERLLSQKMLQPLDKNALTNIKELSPAVMNLKYDPNNTYSIPYFWGNVGIVYNTKKVDPKVVEEQGYSIFQNPDYAGRIYWYDSERDSFMIALKVLGYSMNTENKDEINKAYEWLLKMNDTMNPAYVTDEVIDAMTTGKQKDIAIVYSGDAATVLKENKDMSYFAPNEGTNVWYDAMVIPANAQAPKLANEFINYVMTYDVSLENTKAVGYASPNDKVLKEMSAPDGLFGQNKAYLPRSGYDKDEIFHDNEVIRSMISELWIKVKAHKAN
ncbi:MAG: ABC transporter substrate-binding protein [Proteobacteria bacterium]|nr:ABC transporter substrate-binding protein [Pseudomonadota bacterium]